MREAIEELFRMFKVEPNEDLIQALVLYVRHECLNAEHDMFKRTALMIKEATGKK